MADESAADAVSDRTVTVADGDVTVEKSFSADEFPVPVVSFVLRSDADEPVDVRLVDHIPESFAMEHVGFHPDFESDNWTAYRDHRVEYERTLDGGEEIRTVYGVRLDDSADADAFLDDPELERRDEPADVDPDDVLGRETNQLVRDALAGDDVPGAEGSLSGADVEAALETADLDEGPGSEATTATPAPRARDSDLTPAVTRIAEADGDDAENAEDEAAEATTDDESTVDGGTDEAASDEALGAAAASSVAAALAAELRAGTVAEEDVETLREHFDSGVPTSVEVRLSRVQSRVADLGAYTDALEEFLDENGTGAEILETVQSDVDELSADVRDLADEVGSLDEAQTDLSDDVSDLAGDVADVDTRVDDEVTALRADVESDLDDLRDDLEDLQTEVEERQVADAEEVADIQDELDDVEAELEELRAFRDRLSDAFGA